MFSTHMAKTIFSLIFQGDDINLPVISAGIPNAPYGTSRRTVAQDKRAAKKRKARKRARRLGHG